MATSIQEPVTHDTRGPTCRQENTTHATSILDERARQLRKELGGLKAALTRKSNAMRDLMDIGAQEAEVNAAFKDVESQFDRVFDRYLLYMDIVRWNDEDLAKAKHELNEIERRFFIMRDEVIVYTQGKDQADDMATLDATGDVWSRRSSASSTSSSKRAEAIARKGEFLERARLAKERLELEKEKLELEVEKLKFEKLKLTNCRKVDSDECQGTGSNVNSFQQSCHATVPPVKIEKVAPPSPAGYVKQEERHVSDFNAFQAAQFEHVIEVLQLPKSEIQSFDGDPLSYHSFMRSFDSLVGNTAIDVNSKLNRLVYYCKGKAKKVIDCCLVMNPDEGYPRARQLLHERFGSPFTISEAWIKRVINGPKAWDKYKLQDLGDELTNCVETLRAMGRIAEIDTQRGMVKIVDRLPFYLQSRWRKQAVSVREITGQYPTVDNLVHFIVRAAREANDPIFGVPDSGFRKQGKPPERKTHEGSAFVASVGETESRPSETSQPSAPAHGQGQDSGTKPESSVPSVVKCSLCDDSHTLFGCQRFKSMKPEQRLKFTRERKLCDNCLRHGHFADKCTLQRRCTVDGCGRAHTKFLHIVNYNRNRGRQQASSKQGASESGAPSKEAEVKVQNAHARVHGAGTTMLPIVSVNVRAGEHEYVEALALLDNGSTTSFCSENLESRLGVRGTETILNLTTLEGSGNKSQTRVLSLEVEAVNGEAVRLPYVFIRPDIPIDHEGLVPDPQQLSSFPHLQGIDMPRVGERGVDLIIGQDVPEALTPLEVRKGQPGEPYACRTLLGWTLNGPLSTGVHPRATSHFVTANSVDSGLEAQVQRFWQMDNVESIVDDTSHMSQEDKRVVHLWDETTTKLDGHYEMAIPFKSEKPDLDDNWAIASRRLEHLGRKLARDPDLFNRYRAEIHELIDKGYAERVETPGEAGKTWYIPHHAVMTENKPKLRVVFDCSSTFKGKSLNTEVLQGPQFINPLVSVLIKFRQGPVALMSDIQTMYYQVKVKVKDRDVLRFLWWPGDDMSQPPVTYRMTVHPFGGIWAPSAATYALRRTVDDNECDFNEEVRSTVLHNFYVDDCLKSVSSTDSAIELAHDLQELLKKGGFRLRKWLSNERSVIEAIPTADRAKTVQDIGGRMDSLPAERALGVKWNIGEDTLGFTIKIRDKPNTRRGLLSIVSSTYDPLGLASPCTLLAKRILQDLVRLKVGWDVDLPSEQLQGWRDWLRELPVLGEYFIDRSVVPSDFGEIAHAQVHHFSDASSIAYGAVSYIRLVNDQGRIHCALLMGKSRLNPIKPMTIPRLELSGAVVAVKLDQLISRELEIPLDTSVFWTDSTLVLQYIQNTSRRFHTFVANRVAMIHAGSSPQQWRHVDTKNNPADDASRGLTPEQLLNNQRWKHGPEFLWQSPDAWPVLKPVPVIAETDAEVVTKVMGYAAVGTATEARVDGIDRLIERHSCWFRLKKSVAWLLRVKMFLLAKVQGKKVSSIVETRLTVPELRNAELVLIKYVQGITYQQEIKALQCKTRLPRSSTVYQLDPHLNESGIMCVGGRLDRATMREIAKHQILIPKGHLATLIARHYHEISAHSGREYVLALIRQRFWLIGGRTVVNSVRSKCFSCNRRRAPTGVQQMACLPEDRVTSDVPPFTFVGVDCFGPFMVKRARSMVKRYGCLFTCLTIRAIHIEVLHTMDTDSFINALQRFIARRGPPVRMRSDNGSNFTAGNKELRLAIEGWNRVKIEEFLKQKEVEWLFNPPAASHMGGSWERQIRSVRDILQVLLKEQTLDDEGLETVMCLAESIVNGRPLTVRSDSPSDLEPLTPNHLLLLRSGPVLPPGLFVKEDCFRRRWKQVQYIADVFWHRWKREYLPRIQLRSKWHNPTRNLEPGDVVLVLDESTPRNLWPLGRVVKSYTGQDNLVRSVDVKTRSGVLRRPIDKLCLLESVESHDNG